MLAPCTGSPRSSVTRPRTTSVVEPTCAASGVASRKRQKTYRSLRMRPSEKLERFSARGGREKTRPLLEGTPLVRKALSKMRAWGPAGDRGQGTGDRGQGTAGGPARAEAMWGTPGTSRTVSSPPRPGLLSPVPCSLSPCRSALAALLARMPVALVLRLAAAVQVAVGAAGGALAGAELGAAVAV